MSGRAVVCVLLVLGMVGCEGGAEVRSKQEEAAPAAQQVARGELTERRERGEEVKEVKEAPLPEPEYEEHKEEEGGEVEEAKMFESGSFLKVRELKLTSKVEGRLPVDDQRAVSEGPVLAWVEIENREVASKVTFVWKREGVERSKAELDVGVSPGWRTWARKSFRKGDEGEWTVEVLDEERRLLASRAFRVTR